MNEPAFMISQLKIIDRSHRQKLHLKALDVVLFGPLTRKYRETVRNDFAVSVTTYEAIVFQAPLITG